MLDASVVVAFMNRRDDHERVGAWMETGEEDLVTAPPIVAEIDLLVSRGGWDAARAFHEDLADGAYLRRRVVAGSHARDHGGPERIRPSGSRTLPCSRSPGGSIPRIATLDERYFRAVGPLAGKAAFTLLPADA